jgi:hypothetical protein
MAKKNSKKNISAADIPAKDVRYNATGKAMLAAHNHAVASATSDDTEALVRQLELQWAAILAGDCAVSVDHTTRFCTEVRDRINARRKASLGKNAELLVPITATHVGNMNAQLHLATWPCRVNLAKVLRTFDGLTFEAMTAVARWMRGPHGKGGKWSDTIERAPSRDTLLGVIKKSKKRAPKSASKKSKRNGPTGMPTTPDKALKGLGHVISCLAAFDKAYASKLLGKNERKVVEQSLNGLRGLFTPLRAAMKAKAKADAKAAADKAKGDK